MGGWASGRRDAERESGWVVSKVTTGGRGGERGGMEREEGWRERKQREQKREGW